MRASKLFLKTQRDAPADAELASHKLMIRAGLIKKLGSGLYTWLPLGLKVLNKVSNVVRTEMNKVGAQEILMPPVQPAALWKETGRWDIYGPMLLKMTDRNKREFCYGPTHEEVVTDVVRNYLGTYKQLPVCLYQVQTKFRDEIRPRFGVMRAREFIMKDAYSFHINNESLQNTYHDMYNTYCNIFNGLGLKFRPVEADSGEIGGSLSHEFQVLADSGEDRIAYCDKSDYAANIEKASSALPEKEKEEHKPIEKTDCPVEHKTISSQAKHHNVEEKRILKTLLVKGSEDFCVALVICGDDELNITKAEKLDKVASPLTMLTEVELKEHYGIKPGFIGPSINNTKDTIKSISVYVDEHAKALNNFYIGANEDGAHYKNANWDVDITNYQTVDIREVKEGDPSPDNKGNIKFCRGIEVGHIFQLDDKYSSSMKATVLDENGKAANLIMGCYGIGVSRIVAAAIEQSHDDKGIIWSNEMAPYQIAIAALNYNKSEEVKKEADRLYNELCSKGYEVLLDDRNLRPGAMFADLELIGIPHRVVISDRGLSENLVEYKGRTDDESKKLNASELESIINSYRDL